MLYETIFNRHLTGVAVRDYDGELSYRELKCRIEDLANALRTAADNRHFRVLCCEEPSAMVCVAILAVIKAGGFVLMYQPQAGSIEDVVKHYEVDIVIAKNMLNCADAFVCNAESLKTAKGIFCRDRKYEYALGDVCMGFFTSGTSGQSKCVMITQKNLVANVEAGCRSLTYSQDDVHLLVLPLYHAFGMTCSLLAVLYSGGCLCIGRGPAKLFDDVKVFQPTFIQAVPMMVKMLLSFSHKNGTRIKKILCGGARTDPELIYAGRQCGINVYSCYGLTECSPCVSCNDLTVGKEHTSGRLLECNEVRIDDGEIVIRGTNVMYGYFGEQKQNEWFHTGDCGYLDEDGYLCLTGRKDQMIKGVNGQKIHPEVIETLLLDHFPIHECLVQEKDNAIIASVYTTDSSFSAESALTWIRGNLPHGYQLDEIVCREHPFEKTKLMKIIRGQKV